MIVLIILYVLSLLTILYIVINDISTKSELYIKKPEKYVIPKNFKNHITKPEENQRKYYPRFSKKGYKLINISDKLYKDILKFFKNNYKHKKPEKSWVISKDQNEDGKPNLFITNISMNKSLVKNINNYVENELNKWIKEEGSTTWNRKHQIDDYGDTRPLINKNTEDIDNINTLPLTHTSTYGIRTYGPGNKLAVHLDKGSTHILSAIIFVNKSSNLKNWAIDVKGFEDKEFKPIYMNERNNLLLYESATVFHGRTTNNTLDSYSNLYVHFKPNGWNKLK